MKRQPLRALFAYITHSLTIRLTLLFTLAAILILLILGLAVNHSINQHFIEQDQRDLSNAMTHLQHVLGTVRHSQDFEQAIQQIEPELTVSHGMVARITSADGTILFSSPYIDPPMVSQNTAQQQTLQHSSTHTLPMQTSQPAWALSPLFSWQDSSGSYRGTSSAIQSPYPPLMGASLTIGMDIAHHESFLASFLDSMWASMAVAALLMFVLGWMAAHRGLTPLRQIITTTSRINAHQLSNRLCTDTAPTELQGLVQTLNQMLERLEDSFKRLSNFSSDLAHELRTPISNLKTQTQVVLSRARSVDEYREVLYSNAEELDRLSHIITNMLFLAKADNGLVTLNKEPVTLENEIGSLFEFYEAYAESYHVNLQASGHGCIAAERLMIRRAINNLLSNAIKNSTPNSTVNVSIYAHDEKHMAIAVQNHGQTIPAQHLPHLFDRFYRVDSARHSTNPEDTLGGIGLGLAITHAIIQAHGGSITVHSENGITTFTAILPTHMASRSDSNTDDH